MSRVVFTWKVEIALVVAFAICSAVAAVVVVDGIIEITATAAGPPPPIAQAAPQAPPESPDLVAAIKSEEGFRATPYTDTTGNLTIGYGLNLEGGITRAEADTLLRSRIDHAVQCIERGLGWFITLPQRVQDALTNMGYQLGCAGLMEFDTMLGLLEQGEWEAARDDALMSLWATQTPERAERVTMGFLP